MPSGVFDVAFGQAFRPLLPWDAESEWKARVETSVRAAIRTQLDARTSPADSELWDRARLADASAGRVFDPIRQQLLTGDPHVLETSEKLAEVAKRLDALVEEEKSARRSAEDLRTQIRLEKTNQVMLASQISESRKLRREYDGRIEALQLRYQQALEDTLRTRKAIADLVVERVQLRQFLDETIAFRAFDQLNRWPELEDARKHLVESLGALLATEMDAGTLQAAFEASEEAEEDLLDAIVVDSPARTLSGDIRESEAEDKVLDLTTRILGLRNASKGHRRRSVAALAFGFFLVVVIGPVGAIPASQTARLIVWGYGAGLLGATGLYYFLLRDRAREENHDATEAQNELDLETIDRDAPEQRAQKLLQVNQFDLRRYYDQTLRQGRYIFWVGVGCIGLGAGVIAATFVLVRSASHDALSEQIIVGALGGVAAILTNFIGVVFLRMYSATISSVAIFHNRLVGTHDLYFANLLAAKVRTPEAREQAVAGIALKIASRGTEPSSPEARPGPR